MLNEALKLIRLFHGKTQRELAEELEISVSYLSELEAGNRRINFEIIDKYADIFSIPASSLLLFSEQLDSGKPIEKARVVVAKKITNLMKWVAEQGNLEHEAAKKDAR